MRRSAWTLSVPLIGLLACSEDPSGPDHVARFSVAPTTPVVGEPATFDASTSSGGDSRHWSFGDGTEAQGSVVEHSYAAVGTYEVTLTVTADDGVSASATQLIEVAPALTGRWAGLVPLDGDMIRFSMTVIEAEGHFNGTCVFGDDASGLECAVQDGVHEHPLIGFMITTPGYVPAHFAGEFRNDSVIDGLLNESGFDGITVTLSKR